MKIIPESNTRDTNFVGSKIDRIIELLGEANCILGDDESQCHKLLLAQLDLCELIEGLR